MTVQTQKKNITPKPLGLKTAAFYYVPKIKPKEPSLMDKIEANSVAH